MTVLPLLTVNLLSDHLLLLASLLVIAAVLVTKVGARSGVTTVSWSPTAVCRWNPATASSSSWAIRTINL